MSLILINVIIINEKKKKKKMIAQLTKMHFENQKKKLFGKVLLVREG